MRKIIDLTGQKFNMLIVKEYIGKDQRGTSKWKCLCDCGKETIVLGYSLENGNTKSCGCLKQRGSRLSHGYSKKKIYFVWHSMVQRCTNKNSKYYKYYGERGITVCERWLKFENFLKDMGERPNNKYQLERIDNNLGYLKENCRWATKQEQVRNTRRNKLYKFNNKNQILTDWAKDRNIPHSTLYTRINKYGWSIEKSLMTPARSRIPDN